MRWTFHRRFLVLFIPCVWTELNCSFMTQNCTFDYTHTILYRSYTFRHRSPYLRELYTIISNLLKYNTLQSSSYNTRKGKAIALQALTGPEGSRRLRLPDFMTIGTWRWQGCQPCPPAAFTPRKHSWYSFLLEAESTPGP
jgi:hypothetical protein